MDTVEETTIDSLQDVLLERVFQKLNPTSRATAKLICKRWCSIINTSTNLITAATIKETKQIPGCVSWLHNHPHNAINTITLLHRIPVCDVGSHMYDLLESFQPNQLHKLAANVDRILAAPWDRLLSLRMLQIRSDYKPQIFLNQVAQLPALEVLHYSNPCGRTSSLVTLPSALIDRGLLTSLDVHFHSHELDLYGTDLAPLASSLTELRLTNARAYPHNLGALTNLDILSITQLSEFIPILPPLPSSLSALKSLHTLIIQGVAFVDDGYPECVQSMKQLTQLVLRGEWGVISPALEGLRELKVLELCSGIMDVTALAPLTQCNYLSVLLLGRCCLPIVPELVTSLPLHVLDLAFNHIKRLPNGIYLESLHVLDLSHNRFTKIPTVLKNAKELRELYVHHQDTHIALLDDDSHAVVEQMSKLKKLALIHDGDMPIRLKPPRHLNTYWLPTEFEINVQRLQARGVLVT